MKIYNRAYFDKRYVVAFELNQDGVDSLANKNIDKLVIAEEIDKDNIGFAKQIIDNAVISMSRPD